MNLAERMSYIIRPQVFPYCGPIFFTESLGSAAARKNNGSFGLIDTGSKKLLVTCAHVWTEFQKQIENTPQLKLEIWLSWAGPVHFNPTGPISINEEYDLAVFDMELLFGKSQEQKFFPINECPSPRVKVGDKIFFVGFPGYLRGRIDDKGRWTSGRSPYGMGVREISGNGRYFFGDITKLLTPQSPDEFGGISGCPCYLVRPKTDRPYLVGFATTLIMGRSLRFAHANCIGLDGELAI